jgi:hypothetical protein
MVLRPGAAGKNLPLCGKCSAARLGKNARCYTAARVTWTGTWLLPICPAT